MMGDPADDADIHVERFLQFSLLKHQNNLKQCGDIEAAICKGCSYSSKTCFGKQCDGWRECLEDHERSTKATGRNGNATASI